jgi:sugar phosphate isomerase/epimerase
VDTEKGSKMKSILLCDDGNPRAVVTVAKRYAVGIEFGTFYKPELLENPKQAIQEHYACRDVVDKALHGAFGDLCPGSFDHLVRETARKRVLQSLKVARQLSIRDVIFHHGYVPKTSGPEGWVRRSAEFWKGILRQTPEHTRLHLENFLEDTPEIIMRLVDEENSPRLGVCFDIGHAHALSETSVLEWVDTLGSRISYVHIHDNNGKKDEHLTIGDGCIPIKSVLDAIETQSNKALWAIETLEAGLVRSLEWIRKNYVTKASNK